MSDPALHRKCTVGVTVSSSTRTTLAETLSSLEQAGFPRPRLFCDGANPTVLEYRCTGYEVTFREPRIGGWPNFWLALTEMVARDPNADFYVIVQDDVIFSRGVFDYLNSSQFPVGCGVISMFCAQCHNGPFGWHRVKSDYGMAGAQAFAFPRESAFAFLAHSWTVNHRRAAPKSKHFRGDGLHHIDGVVGEWCRLSGRPAVSHSPSLSQHIGYDSVMYPGFRGKRDRRYADSFPGELLDASFVYPHFSRRLSEWIAAGGSEEWAVSGHLWAMISNFAADGVRTLECGSGLSTSLFTRAGCRHTALEHQPVNLERLRRFDPQAVPSVILTPLEGDPPWYRTVPNERFDLILIDGPPGSVGRHGVLPIAASLVHPKTVIFFDDTCRPADRRIAEELARSLDRPIVFSTSGHHGYACIAHGVA